MKVCDIRRRLNGEADAAPLVADNKLSTTFEGGSRMVPTWPCA